MSRPIFLYVRTLTLCSSRFRLGSWLLTTFYRVYGTTYYLLRIVRFFVYMYVLETRLTPDTLPFFASYIRLTERVNTCQRTSSRYIKRSYYNTILIREKMYNIRKISTCTLRRILDSPRLVTPPFYRVYGTT